MRQFGAVFFALCALWAGACGSSSGPSVDSVTTCLKNAGAFATATAPNSAPYNGEAVSARFAGPEMVAVLLLDDAGTAKAAGAAYALHHTDQSAYVIGDNVIIAPKDADASTLATLRSCAP